MIELQTIIIYLLLTYILLYSAKISNRRESFKPLFCGILFYSLIFGLRYGVGTDYFSYLNNYISPSDAYGMRTAEHGFSLFTQVMLSLNIPFTVYFGIIALIQILFIFLSVRNDRYVYSFLALTFMLDCVWLSYANIIRQSLAFSMFAFSLSYAEKGKIVFHYILVLLAISMHMSATYLILIYPIYLIVRHRGFWGTKIQVVVFLVAVFLGNNQIVDNYMTQVDSLATIFGYDSYLQSSEMHEFLLKSEETELGVGYYLSIVIHLILIFYGNKMCKFYKNDRISFLYKLFFVGSILSYLFASSMMLNRAVMYLHGFGFIIGAYVLYYLKMVRRSQFMILALLYCMIFTGIMYRMHNNDSAYYFVWQSEMIPKSRFD